MPSDWYNPCGVPYRLYEDGRVEVQGAGFPAHTQQAVLAIIQRIWTEYGATITTVARKWGISPAWLVGIIYIESEGKARSSAECEPTYCPAIWKTGGCAAQGGPNKYCAGGLMAFTAGTASIFGHTIEWYMDHPHEMIHDAAHLIAAGGPGGNIYKGGIRGRGGDVLSVVKMYNGGSVCGGGGLTGHGGQADYVSKFLKTCNAFVALGLAPPVASASMGGAGSGALVFLAFAGLAWWGMSSTGVGRRIVVGLR
jgi:hypothetical protein